jgi:SAM-dependent methyltransferase
MNFKTIMQRISDAVYASHNSSRRIRRELSSFVKNLKEDEFGLNIGGGDTTRIHPQVKNLNIAAGENIDIVSNAESIPLANDTVSLIITQETLEHVQRPDLAIKEMYRVLKPSGMLYCQLPFTLGYHPGPTDYWRFTKEGIVELLEREGFHCEKLKVAVGPATGFYRIAVEFFAVLFSLPVPFLYKICKGFFALVFYPVKLLDFIMIYSPKKDKIAGGYYVIAKK